MTDRFTFIFTVILCSLPNTPPIDEGTILWNKARTSIAKVFETFGPVRTPFYSIRINSVSDLPSLGITFGDEVYVIPAHPTLTKYVFPQELMKWRGSDASWKDDNEIPPQVSARDWKF
jgi:H/ACA ribonucleoprotein complex non-core subunit NAF1